MAAKRWVTFDCFGTIMDWNSGVVAALSPYFPGATTQQLIADFRAAERDAKHVVGYRRYRDVLAASTQQLARAKGVELPAEALSAIARQWGSFAPFPDVAAGLEGLRAHGWKLGILTNCDRDLFALTEARLPVPFDLAITAEEIHSYKPDALHFEEFARRVSPDAWVHVANSWVHDVEPAARLGLPCVWVDRDRTGHDASLASAVLPNFDQLPKTVDAYAAR